MSHLYLSHQFLASIITTAATLDRTTKIVATTTTVSPDHFLSICLFFFFPFYTVRGLGWVEELQVLTAVWMYINRFLLDKFLEYNRRLKSGKHQEKKQIYLNSSQTQTT